MEREILVYVDLAGSPVLAGRLWARARGAKESASFEYDVGWLGRRDAFSLDPELPPARGQFHTSRPLFNAFTDPAPDRWGQTLMRRNERARARQEKRQPRTLLTADFLTLVDDETRLGALHFKDAGGDAYLSATGKRVPPVLELPRLLSATTRIIDQRETDDDLLLVLAPGTSLGGARPKEASVRDKDGHLLVAIRPRPSRRRSPLRRRLESRSSPRPGPLPRKSERPWLDGAPSPPRKESVAPRSIGWRARSSMGISKPRSAV
jgi:serine/threonine-protein kinase HipA